jgi:hypothetical protein
MPQAPAKPSLSVGRNSSYFQSKRLSQAKLHEFTLVDTFKLGYRNREEITMLAPGVLITGSQNVVTNTAGRVGVVKGYALDGPASTVLAPILASFDWQTAKGYARNLRAGFLTTAGNDGKLQFRYVNSAGTVTWVDLLTGLTSSNFNFVDFWDFNTEKIAFLLFVNGSNKIYDWSGATTTYASSTINTITKQGTTTWAEEGFLITGSQIITIGSIDYTYTGGTATTTLTGVTPDPTGAGISVGDLIFQKVRSTLNSSMTGNPLPTNDIIGILNNQVYVGNLKLNDVYVSKANSFTDYSFATPRLPATGAILHLGSQAVGFAPQQDQMYIAAGKGEWYQTKFTLSADLTAEALQIVKLKTASNQAARSQAFISKDKNNVIFVSNEPVVSALGPVTNVLNVPQITDVSFSIINDMNAYNFTDGSIFYWKNFILVAIPKLSLIRIYNQTQPKDMYWEAPVFYPVSRFSVINGELYGHSYLTSESYKLFTGYNFRGSVIDARAVFSFNNYGSRFATKGFNEFYYEGRCTQNGTLNLGLQFETEGCSTNLSFPMAGDSQWVCSYKGANSLGKNSIGKQPIGGNIAIPQSDPPKFRKIKTMPRNSFYEESTSFTSVEKDFQWEIIAFGPATASTSEGNNNISD